MQSIGSDNTRVCVGTAPGNYPSYYGVQGLHLAITLAIVVCRDCTWQLP